MKVKETIAFIGKPDKICSLLLQKLAKGDYPLVLVAKDHNDLEDLSRQIIDERPEADIEIISCAREGCWEADIIVLCESISVDPGLTEKIKEVATQKILILFLNKEKRSFVPIEEINKLRKDLPHTQLIQLVFDPVSKTTYLTGTEGAKNIVEGIFTGAGVTVVTL